MTQPGPASGQAPPDELPDDAPATVGELRTLRRWLVVVGVWAVAATAVGLIALLADDDDAEPVRDDSGAAAAERVERSLGRRIDELESQLEEADSSEDVRRLDRRLQQLEDDVSQAAEDAQQARDGAEQLGTRVDDLEGRVDALAAEGDGGPDPGSGEGQ